MTFLYIVVVLTEHFLLSRYSRTAILKTDEDGNRRHNDRIREKITKYKPNITMYEQFFLCPTYSVI
jgi:hypothetical protein